MKEMKDLKIKSLEAVRKLSADKITQEIK